jgi:hypothetical protein
MADVTLQISDFMPDFAKLAESANVVSTFPKTIGSLDSIAEMCVALWRKVAMENNVTSRGGDYVRSIQSDTSNLMLKWVFSDMQTPDGSQDLTASIEEGHPEIDLKPGLLAGPKHRMGRRGPYNIVPFRHGTPGTLASNRPMPMNVYRIMLKESKLAVGAGGVGKSRITAISPVTGRRVYQWGVRLPADKGGAPQTSQAGYTWQTGKYSGMVRMQTSTTKAHSSKYLTFRTVSIHSDPSSWIIPEKAGFPIREKVLEALHPIAMRILSDAIEEDLK